MVISSDAGWARPITLTMLKCLESMLPKVCFLPFESALLKAAFALAFFRAFWSSELIAGSRSDSSGWALAITDVSIEGSKFQVHLRRSKTDQHAWGGVHISGHTPSRWWQHPPPRFVSLLIRSE